jgi:hypothetical protein
MRHDATGATFRAGFKKRARTGIVLEVDRIRFVPGPGGRNRSGTFGVITTARDARIGQLALSLIF